MRAIADRHLLPLLGLLVLLAFAASLHIGPADTSVLRAFDDLLHQRDSVDVIVVMDIRLPRALLALVVGAALGCAGATLQGLLRNPLAGPDLVGVSNCAALGAVIALYFGFAAAFPLALPLMAMLGAGLACLLIFALAGQGGSTLTLILAGVAINAVAGALTAVALNFASSPYAINEMVHWLLGSVADRGYDELLFATPLVLLGLVLLLSSGRYLNALTLGEDTAESLGFRGRRERQRILLGVACAVGAAVAVSGAIGFVGLVVPHWLRPWVGHEPRRLLAASALGGAALILVADLISRQLSPFGDLKLGVVTALIGGPFFLHLVLKTRKEQP